MDSLQSYAQYYYAKMASNVMCVPFPFWLTKEQKELIKGARDFFESTSQRKPLSFQNRQFTTYHWNYSKNAPSILVLHGWMSKSLYMTRIIRELWESGHNVVAIDFPGHGESAGRYLNWQMAVETIFRTVQNYGQFDGVVGHSFGGSMAQVAVGLEKVYPHRSSLKTKNLVLISSPTRIDAIVNPYAKIFNMGKKTKNFLKNLVVNTPHFSPDHFKAEFLLQDRTDLSIYVVHDEDDDFITFENAINIEKLGPHVQVHKTSKLGHIKPCYDQNVSVAVKNFLERSLRKSGEENILST